MKGKTVVVFVLLYFAAAGQPMQGNSCNLQTNIHGTATTTIDKLITHSRTFAYYTINADSALVYATQASKEAHSVGDKCRKTIALLLLADIKGRLFGDPKAMEQLSLEALNTVTKTDLTNTAAIYRMLFLSFTLQGRFSEARHFIDAALAISERQQDKKGIGWAYQLNGFAHAKSGELVKAFEKLTESERIGREIGDSSLTSLSLMFIARIFHYAGEYQKAITRYKEGLAYRNNSILLLWPHVEDLGTAYLHLKKYDSAIYYRQAHRNNLNSLLKNQPERLQHFLSFSQQDLAAQVNIAKANYDGALQQLLPTLQQQRMQNDAIHFMYSLLAISKAYLGKSEYAHATSYGHELLAQGKQLRNNYFTSEANQVLASAYDGMKLPDSAYYYFKNYTALKDSMDADQFLLKAALYEHTTATNNRIQLLLKDKELQQQQLATKERMYKTLIASIIGLVLLGGIWIRNVFLKRKNERLESQRQQALLQKKTMELEMQALRAQMNPHFIFNCLSAIDNLVQTNQTDKATAYLARFAKLIRAVLESTKRNIVLFQQDFETMQLYMEMEQFRCNYKFNYQFNFAPDLAEGNYKVPSFIIQPFIENAIHHGLLNKPGNDRELTISAHINNEHIVYNITDNGIGRREAARLKERNRPDHQSYGIAITRERINLYNKNRIESQDVQIEDIEQNGSISGTKVTVRIIAKT